MGSIRRVQQRPRPTRGRGALRLPDLPVAEIVHSIRVPPDSTVLLRPQEWKPHRGGSASDVRAACPGPSSGGTLPMMRYTDWASRPARGRAPDDRCAPAGASPTKSTAPHRDASSGNSTMAGLSARTSRRRPKGPHMLARTHHSPTALSRRSHAQRRLRRAASARLFCSTNGCTTFMVPEDGGGRAVCPVCGLQRTLRADRTDAVAALSN